LHDHRTKTTYGVKAHLFVGLHDLLLPELGVVLIPVIDDPHTGAKVLHLAGLTHLTNDKFVRGPADQDGECDDGQSKIAA
jgi:hypothetical protein